MQIDKIIVVHSDGRRENFKPRKIRQSIEEETGITGKLPLRIQKRIAKKFYNLKEDGLHEVSTSQIRAEVSSQLLKEREFEAEEQTRKLGMSVTEFEDLLENGCKDNANIGYSPEMIAKYAYDSIAKEYALLKMPEECAEAYKEGLMHIHDMEYYMTRPNCMNYDLRFFAKNGLKIDGKGAMGSVSKPAKSLEVLLNHMLQAWMAGATVFSGGQGYVNFNTLLSPFCRGRSYKDIKQAIQGFIFNCNESLICRGGQVLFSSIALDLSCPDVLKDEPAISFEGIAVGTYKDYQEEADLIFKAVCEVSNEKDGQGAYHRFPNILFNIRKGDLDEYKGTCKILHETGANNPTIYYNNCIDLERSTMGCFSGDTELWCKIDNKLTFLSFKELSELLNADYGVTQIDKKIEVLTINDDKEIIWHKAKNFIKNKNVPLYKVDLPSRKSFICDENHDMLTFKGLNRKNVLECTNGTNLIDVNCSNINVNIDCDPLGVLYGFWLGDGDKTLKRGLITVQKTDKINYIENLFKELNIEYKLSKSERPDYGVNYVENKYWFDKDIFNNIDLTDLNILSGILAGCLSSDGYIRINGEFNKALASEWVTTTKEHSDLFKWCCFNLGITYSSRWINNGKQKPFERIYIKCNESSVHLLKQLKLRDCQAKIVDSVDAEEYHQIKPTKGTRIKNIQTFGKGDSYCLDVNDRIIIGSDFILTANCRSSLPMNYTGIYEKDCVNTGNFMYNTINLPLLALEAGGDVDQFYKKLDEICEICYTSLIHRRNVVIDAVYNKHMSDFLLQKDKDTGEPLWDIDRTTITLGYCGLNECLEVLYGEGGIIEYEDEGVKIIEFINAKKQEFFERDGLRWSVIASPAESTAFKFAEINRSKYPDCPVQGKEGSYYLTNSHHIPVDSGVNWIKHIENAGKFAHLSLGGAILHIWSGEVWSDAEAIWKLNQRILEYGNPIFWAFSKVFTYCQECGFTINDKLETCPICGSKDLRLFDRVTGYYLCIDTFNNGKKQEFEDRHRHKITEKEL